MSDAMEGHEYFDISVSDGKVIVENPLGQEVQLGSYVNGKLRVTVEELADLDPVREILDESAETIDG